MGKTPVISSERLINFLCENVASSLCCYARVPSIGSALKDTLPEPLKGTRSNQMEVLPDRNWDELGLSELGLEISNT